MNWQPNAAHNLFFRFSGEVGSIENDYSSNTAIFLNWEPYQDKDQQFLMDGAAGDTWAINPTTVNQFVAQWLSDKHDTLFPQCPLVNTTSVTTALGADACLSESLATASGDLSSGISNAYGNWFNRERKWQWRDDFSKQIGRHSLKVGVDYVYLPTDGGFFAAGSPGAIYLSARSKRNCQQQNPVSGRIPVAQCHSFVPADQRCRRWRRPECRRALLERQLDPGRLLSGRFQGVPQHHAESRPPLGCVQRV